MALCVSTTLLPFTTQLCNDIKIPLDTTTNTYDTSSNGATRVAKAHPVWEVEEEEESLFKADAVNEEDSERDRATQV